jgi:hypothetical protein
MRDWQGLTFTFWRLHIPTGKRTRGEVRLFARKDFLACLAAWNGNQPGRWQYWERSNA